MTARVIQPGEMLHGSIVSLRLVTLDDCTPRYLAWLRDPDVNAFLETRWREQSAATITDFVRGMIASSDSYLFAIIENVSSAHIGNLKVGPINFTHRFADLSYFIGERAHWGRGCATSAIRLATAFAFERVELHRLQTGIYQSNWASGRALEKAGFQREGCQRAQLRLGTRWEDHVWYGLLRDEWAASAAPSTL